MLGRFGGALGGAIERGLYLLAPATPLDLRYVGRTLLHAALVGFVAGVAGCAFYFGLEVVQRLLLEDLAGYVPLRAHGETFLAEPVEGPFRPWLLVLLPALGALAGGAVTIFAPEARGGGGDAMIEAFHHHGGVIRRRVAWVKALASMLTLGSGGAGGREGPTMQIGGALGSWVGRALKVSARERRILLVAGVAGGIAAVFRTPLGAALLAVEVLYRDDFESDALVPAVLASVVSYSVAISVFGESRMFAHAPSYAFIPAHLPLYGLLALAEAALAAAFVASLGRVRRWSTRMPLPSWARPAVGGLLLGAFATPLIILFSDRIGHPGQGLGVLGGGYGAVQVVITGEAWLPRGWATVELLLLAVGAKLVAASLTIGTGGSAGDFAPSLALGGVFGGAFGRALQLLIDDPRIDPGAFALVGMATFYGGIAHAPLSALVLVCELAGSYDLLVPLMLAEGIAFVALRNRGLYEAQLKSRRDSPAHRDSMVLDVLRGLAVEGVMRRDGALVRFEPKTTVENMLRQVSESPWQEVFPVLSPDGQLRGLVTAQSLRVVAAEPELARVAIAADLMRAPATLKPDEDLRRAAQLMLAEELPEIPVVDAEGRIAGVVAEADVARAYLQATSRAVGQPSTDTLL